MAQANKLLAGRDKTAPPGCTYKAPPFNEAMRSGIFAMEPRRKTIAVVDNDPGVRRALHNLLHIAGFRVRSFAGSEEFLGALATCEADCLVLDIDLQRISGLHVARHPLVTQANIPIILLSGPGDDTNFARTLATGCVAILQKPFRTLGLLDAIDRAIPGPT